MRSVLYRALGQTDTADADLYSRHLKAGDRLILSSDGLPRHLSPEDIATIALRSEDPDVITQELIDLANQRGGEDNISVVVVVAKQDPGSAPLEQLVVIPAEEERASDETLDLFRTAKFGSLPLPDKDPDSDEQG
jgi:protein phosphatase